MKTQGTAECLRDDKTQAISLVNDLKFFSLSVHSSSHSSNTLWTVEKIGAKPYMYFITFEKMKLLQELLMYYFFTVML